MQQSAGREMFMQIRTQTVRSPYDCTEAKLTVFS
jgi:hypothetical protein